MKHKTILVILSPMYSVLAHVNIWVFFAAADSIDEYFRSGQITHSKLCEKFIEPSHR